MQAHASQAGIPEGLPHVLDIIQDSVAPRSVWSKRFWSG
nr:hypothetical protein [Vibrio lentus]